MADVFDGAVSTTLSYFRKEIARLDSKKMIAKKSKTLHQRKPLLNMFA